jgi:hypothetical protein
LRLHVREVAYETGSKNIYMIGFEIARQISAAATGGILIPCSGRLYDFSFK